MVRKTEAGRLVAHLAAVAFVGCALTAVQFQAVLIALFTGRTAALVAVLVVGPALGMTSLAALATSVRTFVPLTRRARGRWAWAAGVYACGTAGAVAVVVANLRDDGLHLTVPLSPWGGLCYALGAAFFLPGTRTRLATLAAAVLLAAGGAYLAWDAARPPTLTEWLTANGVDRGLLRVGEPPSGYALDDVGASESAFGATYIRPGAPDLHLSVERSGHDTRRADARGCPVPFGETIHCADDGDGRQLVTYEGDYPRRELRLRRNGLAHTVTVQGGGRAGLSAARHLLTTLRPATDAELAPLLARPMRR
ncbi:hypothetical protein [Streptomyces endophytica]|uniref:Uncharacterized protein n=1 Tax=Streptomyces endophytica TaxID=2991496 RepID=A0ABY6PI26_9ACTN|nr:hypothetical protein [Streptomyces endophytica]UZJ32812.1 hypothetical protein OJ254_24165 [Streptomyces endophytica]